MLEEEIFYPALRGKIDDADLDEAIVEHDSAKLLINDIEAAEPDDDFYDAKVKVLQEEIEHHIKEEEKERGNIFQQRTEERRVGKEWGSQCRSRCSPDH